MFVEQLTRGTVSSTAAEGPERDFHSLGENTLPCSPGSGGQPLGRGAFPNLKPI